MTVYVTEPAMRGNRMLKPLVVPHPYDTGDNLEHLMRMHPEAIYYTDDEAEFFGTKVSVTEQESVTYEVWERDLHHPTSMPRKNDFWGSVTDREVVRGRVRDLNSLEEFRDRYEFFPVMVTTTRTLQEI